MKTKNILGLGLLFCVLTFTSLQFRFNDKTSSLPEELITSPKVSFYGGRYPQFL
ncbi:MAG: hypothetical protein ACFFAS_03730 [Promethearchaeota archaeon]